MGGGVGLITGGIGGALSAKKPAVTATKPKPVTPGPEPEAIASSKPPIPFDGEGPQPSNPDVECEIARGKISPEAQPVLEKPIAPETGPDARLQFGDNRGVVELSPLGTRTTTGRLHGGDGHVVIARENLGRIAPG